MIKKINKNTISEPMLARLNKYIAENLGLYFPEKRWNDLRDKFQRASIEFGFSDAESCINWLLSAPLTQEQIETLSFYLTIGETSFYRNQNIYNELEKHVLPELINSRRKTGKYIRIWSAGCSSGEEPYSIAILLHKMIPGIKDWNISILATDINPFALKKAKEGIYNKWSFRGTPEWVKDGYFSKTRENSYKIKPYIKKTVSFSYHNLAKDPYPSLLNNTNAIDIIFCRNVIMYFRPQLGKKIIKRFYRSLLDGGWLLVSGSEGSSVHMSQFVTVNLPDAIFFRKDLSKSGVVDEFRVKTPVSTHQIIFDYDPEAFPEIPLPATESPLPPPREVTIKTRREQPKTEEVQQKTCEEAMVLYKQGNYPEVEDILTDCLLHDKKDHKAMTLLAKACSNQGKFSKAIEWCEKEIAINKFNPGCHYLLALIFQEQGKIEEALSSLNRSIYLDPNYVLAHYTLGNIILKKGNFKKAEKYFDNALSILNTYKEEDIIPESDGVSAGRLIEIIKTKI
jgi:chemotaxis protein methyltransferase CheR